MQQKEELATMKATMAQVMAKLTSLETELAGVSQKNDKLTSELASVSQKLASGSRIDASTDAYSAVRLCFFTSYEKKEKGHASRSEHWQMRQEHAAVHDGNIAFDVHLYKENQRQDSGPNGVFQKLYGIQPKDFWNKFRAFKSTHAIFDGRALVVAAATELRKEKAPQAFFDAFQAVFQTAEVAVTNKHNLDSLMRDRESELCQAWEKFEQLLSTEKDRLGIRRD